MKANQYREMEQAELQVKLKDLKSELFNLRFRHTTGQLQNPLSLHECKKDIARVCTILREQELNSLKGNK